MRRVCVCRPTSIAGRRSNECGVLVSPLWRRAVVSEAVVYTKYLAADLRCLEPDIRPRLSIQVIGEGFEQTHKEAVFP